MKQQKNTAKFLEEREGTLAEKRYVAKAKTDSRQRRMRKLRRVQEENHTKKDADLNLQGKTLNAANAFK